MLLNYFKVTFRNIMRHKGYAFINVVGLALGLACCLLIMLLVMDELSYDKFHENADYLYRVEQDQNYSGRIYHVNVTPYPMAEGLKTEIPEVKDATPFPYAGTLLLRYGEKAFFEGGTFAVTPAFLRMFSFPLLRGDAETVLSEPYSLVVTENIAQKYFGNEDPMDKVITINNEFDFTVTGIMQNPPSNSVIQFDMLIPFTFLEKLGRTIDQWGWNSIVTYVQLHEDAVVEEVNDKISDLRQRKVRELLQDSPEDLEEFERDQRTEFMVAPLPDIRLHSHFGYGHAPGAIMYVYVFIFIALFILLIACINFMNLATARSANRAREVGMRKVVGALKGHLVRQFYSESLILSFIALLFALLLVLAILEPFNTFAEKDLSIQHLFGLKFIVGMLAVTFFTGFIAGSYPALYLSAFRPVRVLKGGLSSGARSALFRKVMVVVQFSLSILLIISTVVVYSQSKYMRSIKIGYDKEHLLYIPLRGETRQFYEVLKSELLKDPKIVNVTGTNHTPTNIGSNSSGGDWDGKDSELEVLISFNSVGFDYVETMGIDITEGRSFSKSFSTDTARAFMINEELAKIMGFESAVDQRFEFLGVDGTIVGVMKNYHFQSVRDKIEPLAIRVRPDQVNYIVIKLQPVDIDAAVDFVEATWTSVVPNYPFTSRFVDDDFDRMYQREREMGKLLSYFTALAIIIACLGLFGLASYTAEQRTKEIGVRKVLGASIHSIIVLLSIEFTKWVLVANVIAWPAAYLLMRGWLQSFAYRINLGLGIFLISGLAALIIALCTVSYQSIKASLTNPAEALQYE